jgi:hypothetical protein
VSCYAIGDTPPGFGCPQDCVEPSCDAHADLLSCASDPACSPSYCCGDFNGCYTAGAADPEVCTGQCPAMTQQTCNQYTDAQSCTAAGCQVVACCPEQVVCIPAGEPPPSCPIDICEGLCATYTDQATCDSASGCYSVLTFAHAQNCESDSCQVGFDHCASGAAACSTTELCHTSGQSEAECPAPYANTFGADGCVNACVAQSVCDPTP